MGQQDAAVAFGVTKRTLRNWELEGFPHRTDGTRKAYPLRECIEWRLAREVESTKGDPTEAEMDAARLRKLEADAESKELDLAVKRGGLVPLDEVEVLLREALETIDSVLRHAPSRMAPKLAKAAKIPLKRARTIMEDVVEAVRASVREDRED